MKLLAGLFILFLIGVVLVANLGWGAVVFGFLAYLPFGDKVGHFVLMGILSFLVNRAIGPDRIVMGRFELQRGSLILLAIVSLEEFSQLFLKYRGFSLLDLACDYAGILIFGVLAERLYDWKRSLSTQRARQK